MGIAISKPDAYVDPVRTVYRSHSKGSVALAVCSWLWVLILPLITAILMGGFWLRHDVFVARPDVRYEGKSVMRILSSTGNEYLWTSSELMQEQLLAGDSRFVLPFVSLQEDDKDGDGLVDDLFWNFEIPLKSAASGEQVVSFEFLPALRYKFNHDSLAVEDEVFVSMETAPFIRLSLPSSPGGVGSNVFMDGRLKFDQYQPLHSNDNYRYDRFYNVSHFPKIRDVSDLSNIANLATMYSRRNETTVFEQRVVSYGSSYPQGGSTNSVRAAGTNELSPTAGDTDPHSFNLAIQMRVDPVEVAHVPAGSQVFKHAWVQYFCLAYVVYWFWSHVRRIIVKGGLVDTIAVVDGRNK